MVGSRNENNAESIQWVVDEVLELPVSNLMENVPARKGLTSGGRKGNFRIEVLF